MFDDAKPSRHYDALGRHQIVIFISLHVYENLSICMHM